MPTAYQNSQDAANDFAFVEFPRGGKANDYIGNVISPWQFIANKGFTTGERIYAIGYPHSGRYLSAEWYYGFVQYYCDSTYNSYSTIGSGYELWITCTSGKGNSGGPWFVQNNGYWYVGGLNNRCWGPKMDDPDHYCEPNEDWARSTYFDSKILSLWDYVQAHLTW